MVTSKQYKQLPVKRYLKFIRSNATWEVPYRTVWRQYYLWRFVSSVEEKMIVYLQPECKMCLPAASRNNQHNDKKYKALFIFHNPYINGFFITVVSIFTQALILSSKARYHIFYMLNRLQAAVDNNEHGGPCLALSNEQLTMWTVWERDCNIMYVCIGYYHPIDVSCA